MLTLELLHVPGLVRRALRKQAVMYSFSPYNQNCNACYINPASQ
jgi:hypothetical protein